MGFIMSSHFTIFLIWVMALSIMSEPSPSLPEYELNEEDAIHQHGERSNTDDVTILQNKYPSSHLVLEFPKPSQGLTRRKRDWIIPPLSFPENSRGSYPKLLATIRSNYDKEVKIQYSITGSGADQPPVGLFTVNKNNGNMYVTEPLDREKQDKYLLVAHAVAVGSGRAEEPMEIIVKVIDQNDNKPIFTQKSFVGIVPETAQKGFKFMTVTATDLDEPGSYNSDVRYSIIRQEPPQPSPNTFSINSVTGVIMVYATGLDREKCPKYTLTVMAADMEGDGLTTSAVIIIHVVSHTTLLQFEKSLYSVSVPENEVGALVVNMSVSEELHTLPLSTKYRIVDGDPDGAFNISTGAGKLEGIITTAKALDFEKKSSYTLFVTVDYDVQSETHLPTSTATIQIIVKHVNKFPIFDPVEKFIKVSKDLPVGSDLALYTAIAPDTAHQLRYHIDEDPAKWFDINAETGMIKTKHPLDRDSPFVKDGKYRIVILAKIVEIPVTGTGTIVLLLDDVNNNAPTTDECPLKICNLEPNLVRLVVRDRPGLTEPFSVELLDRPSDITTQMDNNGTVVELRFKTLREKRTFDIDLRVIDAGGLYKDHVKVTLYGKP
ncbi:hypothetical protein UPYG_G00077780 [Umbra pygmaea]|uniref:Cadherin domain-containing protein n=1 Tax=Umbra pygmaea TaxID=75934 RepID=A0ABD0XD89_UMBPY